MVTSSIALEIVEHLDSEDKKIIWGPDRHLGSYIQKQTGADMLLWQGECVVHDEFSAKALRDMKNVYPDAAILVHPESPASVVALADAVGSTSQLIKAAKELPNQQLIVATDKGIFFKMQQMVPGKELIEAPTAGAGATCRSCAHCPWMAMNGLKAIEQGLREGGEQHEIFVDESLREKSLDPTEPNAGLCCPASGECKRQRVDRTAYQQRATLGRSFSMCDKPRWITL